MTTPVFVIHGIGARNRQGFTDQATDLGRRAGFTAHPVYWGDLGARSAFVELTIPGGSADIRDGDNARTLDPVVPEIAVFLAGDPGGADEIRDGTASVPPAVLAAALDALAGSEIRDVPPRDAVEVETALRNAWPSTTWLAKVEDPALLVAVGSAVTRPLTETVVPRIGGAENDTGDGDELRDGDEEIRGLDIGGFVRRRLDELDRVVGAAFGAAAGRLNTHIRSTAGPRLTQVLGDALVYQRRREEIQARVREVIADVDPALGRDADHPVDVVAPARHARMGTEDLGSDGEAVDREQPSHCVEHLR